MAAQMHLHVGNRENHCTNLIYTYLLHKMLILSVCLSLCLSHQKVMNGTSDQNIPFTKMANFTKTASGVDRMHGSKDREREPLEPSIIITVNPHPSCYHGAILTKSVVLLGKVRYMYMYGLVVLCSQTLLN